MREVRVGVIEDEIIGLAMFGNEHGEVRDKFLPLGPLGLMHHIQAVWKGLRLGETIGICQQDIPFRLFGVLVTARTGQVDLKSARPPAARSAPHRW